VNLSFSTCSPSSPCSPRSLEGLKAGRGLPCNDQKCKYLILKDLIKRCRLGGRPPHQSKTGIVGTPVVRHLLPYIRAKHKRKMQERRQSWGSRLAAEQIPPTYSPPQKPRTGFLGTPGLPCSLHARRRLSE